MLKKLTLFIFFLFFVSSLFAQQGTYLIRPNGEQVKLKKGQDLREAIKGTLKNTKDGQKIVNNFHSEYQPAVTAAGVADTMKYDGTFNTNFGFTGQDYMMTWFVAPADIKILAAGFSTSDQAGVDAGDQVSVRLLKLQWTKEDFDNYWNDGHAAYLGYYPGDGDGFNNVAALPEEATGEWVSKDTLATAPSTLPWSSDVADYDLWSDFGFGWPVSPTASDFSARTYDWVEMSNLGVEPEVTEGTVVAVLIKHEGTTIDDGNTPNRIGFWSDTDVGYPCLKWYEAGRNTIGAPGVGDPGWWVRMYTWDFVLAVEITSDRGPVIQSVDALPTTLDQGPFTVNAEITDDNPSGGPAGIGSAELVYTYNGGDEQVLAMTGTEPNFSAELPAGVPGDQYTYYVRATDVEGLEAIPSSPVTFNIFEATTNNVLVVFNGFTAPAGYPQSYYWGNGDWAVDGSYGMAVFSHDVWSYGPLTAELVNKYNNIIEITTNGPNDNNREVIANWLAADGTRNYAVWGDEYLGGYYGWPADPFTIPEGDFDRDVLGIDVYTADVLSPAGDVATPISMVEGTDLGGPLYDYFTGIQADSGWTSTMIFDPINEGVTTSNWADGITFTSDVTVFVNGYSPDAAEYALGGNRVTANGNKIAFMAYDPLPITSSGDDPYWWYGFLPPSPQTQILEWFDALVVGVDNAPAVQKEFNLAQNYPNPFNPSTTIKYSLTENAKVSLKVYDILGKEVATLIDKSQAPGSYEFDFNAANLASGMYIYTLRAGDFVSSKKMMLLK